MNDNYVQPGNRSGFPNRDQASRVRAAAGRVGRLSVPQIQKSIDVPLSVAPILVDPKLSERDAADILGIWYETLKKWRQRGTGPSFIRYRDGAIRYRLSVVEKYIADCTVERES